MLDPFVPLHDLTGVTVVDTSRMRFYKTAVFITGVSVRHLYIPPSKCHHFSKDGAPLCSIAIEVSSSKYVTAVVPAIAEAGDAFRQVDEVMGCEEMYFNKESSSRGVLYCMDITGLELLYPGTRRTNSEMGSKELIQIENPRRFTEGIRVTVHSGDREFEYTTATSTCSGEAVQTCSPRGEVIVHFRVMNCVDGVVVPSTLRPWSGRGYPQLLTNGRDGASDKEVDGSASSDGATATDARRSTDTVTGTPDDLATQGRSGGAPPNGMEEAAVAAAPTMSAPRPADEVEGSDAGTIRSTGSQLPLILRKSPSGQIKNTFSAPSAALLRDLLPCVTEASQEKIFSCYDAKKTGAITGEQLVHFCRAHEALFDDVPEDMPWQVLYQLFPYVTVRRAKLRADDGPELSSGTITSVDTVDSRNSDSTHATLWRHVELSEAQDVGWKSLHVEYPLFSLISLRLAQQ